METKVCKHCKENKLFNEFSKRKDTSDKLHIYCKPCIKIKFSQNKEKLRQAKKEWSQRIKGIYGWFDEDIVLYIGQSKQLLNRISTHKTWLKNIESVRKADKPLYYKIQQHPNASIRIIEECSPELLLEREQYYINTLKPLYNNYGNKNLY